MKHTHNLGPYWHGDPLERYCQSKAECTNESWNFQTAKSLITKKRSQRINLSLLISNLSALVNTHSVWFLFDWVRAHSLSSVHTRTYWEMRWDIRRWWRCLFGCCAWGSSTWDKGVKQMQMSLSQLAHMSSRGGEREIGICLLGLKSTVQWSVVLCAHCFTCPTSSRTEVPGN